MSDARKKKTGVFVWGVMGLLVLGLGGFGLTGAFRTAGGSVVATVGGEEITADAYLNTLQRDLARASQQYGQNITFDQARLLGLDQQSLRRQLTLAALTNEAKRLNLSVGNGAVRSALLANPAFQVTKGVFSEATYDLVLNRQRMTRPEYEALLRKDQTQTLMSGAISGAVGPQKTAARVLMDFIGETRDITWAKLDASVLPTKTETPDEATIRAYYDANPEVFTTPETRSITYAMLTPDMLAANIEISDAAIQEVFDARKDQLNTPERRIVDRIVFGTADEAAAAMARITAGEATFEDIATERGLTANDFAVGPVRANQLSPAAATLLFATKDTGIFGPVEATLGPAIFRVNAALDGTVVALKDVRGDIRDELATEQANTLMLKKIGDIADRIAGGATVEDLANETDMKIFNIAYSDKSTEDITTDPAFKTEALAAGVGEDRDLIELANSGVLALRVDEITPATLRPYQDAHDEAAAAATAAATLQRVQDFAAELIAQVKAGADFSATLSALGVPPQTVARVTRTAPPANLPPLVGLDLFKQDEGAVQAYPDDTGTILIEVNHVQAFDPESDTGKTFITQAEKQVKDDIASDMYILFANAVLGTTDVKVNQGIIDQILASFGGAGGGQTGQGH